jgi:hypothetical protein
MRWIRNEKGRMEQSIRIVGIILAAFLFIGVTGFVSTRIYQSSRVERLCPRKRRAHYAG